MTDLSTLRLVIAGSFGYRDIGDEAMLTEDLRFIHEDLGIRPQNVTLFGQDTEYLARYHDHPQENCLQSRRLERLGELTAIRELGLIRGTTRYIRTVREGRLLRGLDRSLSRVLAQADAALITGGGTINTRDARGYSLQRMAAIVTAFRRYRLPLFISGQTIGPLGEHSHHDLMAKEIVETADVLTVRDRHYSRRYLDLIGAAPRELIETFDDAYTLDHTRCSLPDETAQFLDTGEDPAVVVNVTEYTSETFADRAHIARLCDWLLARGDKILLLSHTPRDQVRLFQIHDMIDPTCRDRVHLPDAREWTGAQLKQAISRCRLAIGGRYHFVVFAGTTDTPFVGMAGNHYSYVKQHGFAEPIGLSRFVLTERETRDFDTLIGRVREAEALTPNNASRFTRPSVSMKRFGKWLTDVATRRP
ncbi:MAG: polysaccharide pyruvyl transferase family protein [Pseudomonadota bacterium]